MVNGDLAFEIRQLKQTVQSQNELSQKLLSLVNPNDEMWDDQDMIKYWKVSKRTIAAWRADDVISYTQYKNKIWYPREAREAFIATYTVKSREEASNGK